MIRLQRTGRVHEPTFRVVLTDSKNSTKSGKYLEVLGNYDPRSKGTLSLNKEKIVHWISMGAKTSDTMHNILVGEKIINGAKIKVTPRKPAEKKEEVKEAKAEAKEEKKEVVAEAPAEVAKA